MDRVTTGRAGSLGLLAVCMAAVLLTAGRAGGQTVVGYWRMETDADTATAGAQVPNQVAGGSMLSSATAVLAQPVPGPGGTPVSGTSQIADPLGPSVLSNSMALDGNTEINAVATSYAALNVQSITVEGFFRSQEGTATLVSRLNGTTSGFSIAMPNNVTVTYVVNGASRTLAGTTAVDLDVPYTHVAFTYDALTGTGSLYANGVLRGTRTDAPGGLYAGAETTDLSVGAQYDGAGLSSGAGVAVALIDEVRITNAALTPAQFLTAVPEPGAVGLLAAASAAGLLRRRNRRAGV